MKRDNEDKQNYKVTGLWTCGQLQKLGRGSMDQQFQLLAGAGISQTRICKGDQVSCRTPKPVLAETTSHSWMALSPASVELSKELIVTMLGEKWTSEKTDF